MGPAEHLQRVYRHVRCDGETVVSGDDYVCLENAFRPVSGTYCCTCQDFAPLDQVFWVDTDENVADYRRRIYDSVPWKTRWYYVLLGSLYEGALPLQLDSRGRPLRDDARE